MAPLYSLPDLSLRYAPPDSGSPQEDRVKCLGSETVEDVHGWSPADPADKTPRQIGYHGSSAANGSDAKQATKEAQRMALRDLRKSLGITQKQLSESLKVSQPVISDMENRADYQLTTLRRGVQAMGGELDVIARFPDRIVALHVA